MPRSDTATKKPRSSRPFAVLHRTYWENMAVCPSAQVVLQTPCGRATQRRFLDDIQTVMVCLVNNMCLRTRKVGVSTQSGFFLYTWEYIGVLCDLPLWRVKQCVKRIVDNGWVQSKQPREKRVNGDREQWTGLVSLKRVTEDYFASLGLLVDFKLARKATKKHIEALARKFKRSVSYILTPITLLARRRREKIAAPPPL